MDPILRLEIDAFLADIWSGTPLEIAESKAGLAIHRVADLTEDDVQKRIDDAIGNIFADIDAEAVMMKRDHKSEAVKAISIDDLRGFIDQWYEGD